MRLRSLLAPVWLVAQGTLPSWAGSTQPGPQQVALGFTRQELLARTAAPSPGPAGSNASHRAEKGHPSPDLGMARACRWIGQRQVDAIVYGDEPAGLLTALELSQQWRRRHRRRRLRILVLTDADTSEGLGGTVARGWLAYLDRNQVPRDLLGQLPPFAPSSELYGRWLRQTGVQTIAIDPRRSSNVFRQALRHAGIPIWDRVKLQGVRRQGDRLCVLTTANHGSVGADLFIDASLGGALARAAGVAFQPGLGPDRLASKSLSLGWIFTVEGLSLQRLRQQEERLTWKLLDPHDPQARQWLAIWPPEQRQPNVLVWSLLDANGQPRLSRSFSGDSADQQSPVLSLVFHGQFKRPPGLSQGAALLDRANIALLPGRLIVNALLFRNDAVQNRRVLAGQRRALPWMRPVARDVERFFLRLGARRVRWAPELYVRSVDQIAHPRQVLDVASMAFGGVPEPEALGSFTYALDLRGGLPGIPLPRIAKPTFNFGYRHTLPQELSNLAVLGPAGGFGGLAVGAGRIIELNVSVGQGLAIAAAEALQARGSARGSLAAVDPRLVAQRMPHVHPLVGRPSGGTVLELLLRLLRDWLDRFSPSA